MGSAYSYDTKAGRRWEARYRKPDGKTARKGGFLRKRDAEAYIAEIEVSKSAGARLRWGEVTGLRVGTLDLNRRRVLIEKNVAEVDGHVQVGTSKTHERRAVVYPACLDNAVSAAAKGKAPDGLLWPAEFGGYLRPGNAVSGWFSGAVKRIRAEDAKTAAEAMDRGEEAPPIMPRVTLHDLRHTAASLAISAGANVKAVQRMAWAHESRDDARHLRRALRG